MTGLTRRGFLVGVGATVTLPLVGCGPVSTMPNLTMATGDAGGSYFQFGQLLRAALLRRQATALTVLTTNGSAENLDLLADRTVDLAIALADTAATYPPGFVAIGRVYQNYLHCVVRADGPVNTLRDIEHQPVSIGAPGSGTAVTARRILDVLDLISSPHSAIVTDLTLGEAVAALSSEEIAAFFWSGGIPTPQINQLSDRIPVKLLDVAGALNALSARYPDLYVATSIPSGVYGANNTTPTIGIPNLLVARPDLSDRVVEILVDTLIEDTRQLVPADSVGVQYLTPANLIDTSPLPLHPAAKRRYRERYG